MEEKTKDKFTTIRNSYKKSIFRLIKINSSSDILISKNNTINTNSIDTKIANNINSTNINNSNINNSNTDNLNTNLNTNNSSSSIIYNGKISRNSLFPSTANTNHHHISHISLPIPLPIISTKSKSTMKLKSMPVIINGYIYQMNQPNLKSISAMRKGSIMMEENSKNDNHAFLEEISQKNRKVVTINAQALNAEFEDKKKSSVFKILRNLNKIGVKRFIENEFKKEGNLPKSKINLFLEELNKESKENNEFHSFVYGKPLFMLNRRQRWSGLFEKNLGLKKFPKLRNRVNLKNVLNKDCIYFQPNISAFYA